MRYWIGRAMQVAGLVVTGWICVVSFSGNVSEGAMFAYGGGGFVVFFVGTLLVKGRV